MRLSRVAAALLTALTICCIGCDEGLAPLNEPSGFSGVISFRNWPPADSVRELRLVAFQEYPSDSSGIIPALLAGRAVIYPQIAEKGFRAFVDTIQYSFTTRGTNLQVVTYNYVAVAWQYGSNVFADWRPAGVYTLQPGTFEPAPVHMLLHQITPNIDIQVDFHNPPPNPWR
jgi:hypothetical protein